MYVPGRISDSEKVLIDIGTGYYVEKVRVLCFYFHLSLNSCFTSGYLMKTTALEHVDF